MTDRSRLARQAVVRIALAVPCAGALFFLTAGTLDYWEAWVYLGVLFVPVMIALPILVRRDPALLERRMRARERERAQSPIIIVAGILLTAVFVVPGLDRRFGWSSVPPWAVLVADALVLGGYAIVYRTFRENTWAGRVIEVEAEQQVISTGPYRVVRHPMYVGVLLTYLATPVALGSWWAVIPALALVPTIMLRAVAEERTLERDLAGYREYERRTRYRLVPGLW